MWESPTVYVTMDAKRRLTVPVAAHDFSPGDTFEAHFDPEESEIVFRRVNTRENWVEVMLRCPIPMDDLPPRSRELPKELNL
jgi:bifunctional DNA-binding transcriptional regulator/antitoxin component of YhaV-PrlF toxin-antitoxin module